MGRPDLVQLAAEQVAALLDVTEVGSSLLLDSSSNLCDIFELLVPAALRREHPEWDTESIDGFFIASSTKNADASAEIVGTCILISDQTVTPFVLSMTLTTERAFRAFRIRLGERGGAGRLAISGPKVNSRAADELLGELEGRLSHVDWVYDLTVAPSSP